jgi:Caspase domain
MKKQRFSATNTAQAAMQFIVADASRLCQALYLASLCSLPLVHAQAPARAEPDRNLVVQKVASSAAVQSAQRVALVIGNASYKEAPLLNPVNDARAIAKALQESGFTVILRENADQRTMAGALREFGDKLRAGGTGLFYYAGHGMQIKGRNFLIPVGANVDREDEVAYSAVDAQAVLDKMEAAGNGANIMILDACRNNPFTRSMRSGQAGLAQMDAPVGTLVAFATSPGAVASDGAGQNGLYTQHLLEAMRKEGSKVEDVFKQVRANVRRDSQGKQVPWEATSMEGDFYFRGGKPISNASLNTQVEIEQALWDAVKNSQQIIELRAYLNRYPEGRFSEIARQRIGDLQSPVASIATPAPTPAPATLAQPNSSAASSVVRISFVAGDSWDIQTEDVLAGKISVNTQTVESVASNGDATMNKGHLIVSASGGTRYVRQDSRSRERYFDGDFRNIASRLSIGFKEPVKYTVRNKPFNGKESLVHVEGHINVLRREKVITPAGSFMAWVTQRSVIATTEDGTTYDAVTIAWFVPEIKRIVALNHTETNRTSKQLSQSEKQVLKAYRMGDSSMQAAIAANQREANTQATGVQFAQASAEEIAEQAALDRRTQELLDQLAANRPVAAIPATQRPDLISNASGFTLGDRWRYQVVDKFKAEVVSTYSQQIDAVLPNGDLRLNNGGLIWNGKGELKYAKNAERERFYENFVIHPEKLEAGYKQSSEYAIDNKFVESQRQFKETSKQTMIVRGRETVKTPAGEFIAWRIERDVWWQTTEGAAGSFNSIGWYVPALRRYVAFEEESRNRNGSFNFRQRTELTSYSVRGADEALAKR